MQLFSYNPHPFHFTAFPNFICLRKCFYFFSQHVLASSMSLQLSQHVSLLMPRFIALMLLAYPSWTRVCLNFMFVLRSTCFQAPCHVYAQIYMPICSLPCLCLDPHVYVFLAMFMLKSTYLCVLCHVYAQIYMLVFRSMFLYLDLCVYVLCAMLVCSYLCWLLCHVPPLISLFLAFWSFQWGVDIAPMVQAYIHTPIPILKGLDQLLCMSVFACLLLCFISILASLDLSFAILCALCGLVLVWLHPSYLGFVWM